MNKKAIVICSALVTLGGANLAIVQSAHATNMMNMFNPSKWLGSNSNSDRRYRDDYYYDRPYSYRGYGPGWGGYGYGPGYGGYGPGWGGYGPYGYGAPGYAAPQQTQRAPERIPQ